MTSGKILIDNAARARIGEAMHEKPEVIWRVMDHDEQSYVQEFHRGNSENPRADCAAWVATRHKFHP